MPLSCPPFQPTVVIADDPLLAARLSCALSQRGTYLAVIDGPRMARPDHASEVIRRNNAVARVQPDRTLLAGLADGAREAMIVALPRGHAKVVVAEDVAALITERKVRENPPLQWGREAIGLGLLRALYEQRMIEFGDHLSPTNSIKPRSGHLVVCEAGEMLTEVIAANYAYSMGAGLHLIEETDATECNELLEAYYGIYEPGVDQEAVRDRLQKRLRALCRDVDLPVGGSLTFITRQLPFGVAFPELPSTHLFTYPDLGISIVNGFAAEQRGTRGSNVAVLVDPEKVRAPEIEAAARLLPARGIFVRGYSGRGATVRNISEMVDHFPYDLLIFATHCGDADGWRWTYQFEDSEGLNRTLIVDIAIGVASTDDPEMLEVLQYERFVSLDGVDWTDPIAKETLYVGSAIVDYASRVKDDPRWEPVHREAIPRVLGSAAMAMADNNYIAMPRSLACEGSPIVINNACVSWHQLADRFMFSNARAYIGTLMPVADLEAEAIIIRVLDKYFGKPLAHAVWSAQKSTYGDNSNRRPYVVTGVYPQRLRVTREDAPRRILAKLMKASRDWQSRLSRAGDDESLKNGIRKIIHYHDREIPSFRKRWFPRS